MSGAAAEQTVPPSGGGHGGSAGPGERSEGRSPLPSAAAEVDALLARALEEDRGPGDLTSETLVPGDLAGRGRLVARAPGVLAGLFAFARVFELLDPRARATTRVVDGARVEPGSVVCEIEGSARTLLVGERTALNVVQRLSGIATLTRRFVEAAAGGARIHDTRKTTPGMRSLEKYAVRCGGGENHRFGLFDEAMLKNNHLDLLERPLGALVGELRARHGPGLVVHAEARDEAEALAAIEGGADVVLLDNMDAATLRELAPRLRSAAAAAARSVALEASGGVTLETGAAVAASGVDRVSVGALTHSAPALDLALRIEAVR